MKKCFRTVLGLALCAAMLCLPAAAAEKEETPVERLGPVCVWGKITGVENGSLLLENQNEASFAGEIVVHLSEGTPVVDAVSGLPLESGGLKVGDIVCAWVGPAMTMSLPPQAGASVVVGNIPADLAVPQYIQVAEAGKKENGAGSSDQYVDLVTAGGETLRVTTAAEFTPWLTRQIVTIDDLVPGARALVWRDKNGDVSKVLLFAYEYRSYLSRDEENLLSVSGETLKTPAKTAEGETLLPVRAVAEAAGYQVDWVPGKGAVVSDNGVEVLSVLPGQKIVHTPDGDWELGTDCLLEKGVTYLPAFDLAHLLDLFI